MKKEALAPLLAMVAPHLIKTIGPMLAKKLGPKAMSLAPQIAGLLGQVGGGITAGGFNPAGGAAGSPDIMELIQKLLSELGGVGGAGTGLITGAGAGLQSVGTEGGVGNNGI